MARHKDDDGSEGLLGGLITGPSVNPEGILDDKWEPDDWTPEFSDPPWAKKPGKPWTT